MELISKFKKAFAILATVALVSTNAPIAFAQTFNDVPTDHWAFDYIEQLVDEGVFDVADTFRPGDALNRAELVKIVITAVDGLAGYEAPATPTFDDVAADAWFYDYVEAAVQLDIVQGYTDAKGNLTGKFGPSDVVNRAQATKILVNAFGVSTTLEPAGSFPDVEESAWFYEYVTTAYNQSILDGYDNGKFGPGDPVTRAQVAKLVVNAQDPVLRVAGEGEEGEGEEGEGEEGEGEEGEGEEGEGEEGEGEEGEGEGEEVSEGDLEISLNDTTPRGSTLPTGASSVNLVSFDLTAAEDDVSCTNVVITRGGVGQVGDWAELFLYDGITRLTTGRTVNNDTNVATFPLSFKVDAGTTKTLRLVGRVAAAAAANNQHYFYLASAGDFTCNAQAIAGDFPVAGNTFTVGGVAVNTLTFQAGTAIAQPLIGAKDAEVSSIRMLAGATNDITIHQLTLTQGGTLASSRLNNCKLLRGTDVVATAESFGDRERISFVLDTPYLIPKGQTKNWYVRCDIDGGRATDTLQLYLDETSDAVTVDQQYGQGANITNTFALANVAAVTLKGGKVTITDNGPAAKQVASNITNIELLNFSVTTDRDLTVRDATVHTRISNDGTDAGRPNIPAAFAAADTLDAEATLAAGTTNQYELNTTANQAANYQVGDTLRLQNAAATTTFYVRVVAVDADTSDGVAGSLRVASQNALGAAPSTPVNGFTIIEVNGYSLLKNLRIVDMDTGGTLQGPLTLVSQGTSSGVADTLYRRQFTEDYELKAGTTRHLSVMVDTDQNMPAGYQVTAQIDFDTTDGNAAGVGFIKDFAANENIAAADIVGNDLVSKPMTIAQNSLALGLSASPNPSNTTFIKGQREVESIGVNFTAGDAGPITLKKLIFHVIATGQQIADFDVGNSVAGEADNDVTTGERGDIDPRTLVASASLWEGTTLLAEPKGLVIADGTYTNDETDEANVTFDSLNIAITAGTTKTLTVRLNLQSSVTTVTAASRDHTAVFIRAGTNDVTAEDKDANAITPTGGTVNLITAADTFNRLVTVELSGTLTVRENSSPQSSLKVAGATKQLVAQYEFAASREAWNVNEVTVINDAAGAFAGNAVDTSSVRQVWVEYPDVNGVTQTLNQSLAVGVANFSNLNPAMHVRKDEVAVIKVYADIQMGDFGQVLSGQSFRLGLRDDNANSADGTFRAVGAASGESLYNPAISGAANVYGHIVRFSVPTVAKEGGDDPLADGAKDLFKVKITADPARGFEVKRIVFRTSVVFLSAGDDLYAFRIREGVSGSDMLSTEAAIIGRTTADAVGDGTDAVDLYASSSNVNGFDSIDGDDNVAQEDNYVVVDFVTARTVSAGSSKIFVLKATVTGANQTGERVATNIPDDVGNSHSAGAGTLAKVPGGCFTLIEPGVGGAAEAASPGAASTGTSAYVITDLDCDAVQDAGEYALLVAGIGNGTTGVTAQAADYGTQVVKTIGTEAQGILAGTILRGQLGLFDTSNIVANDHFFWFDEDADGVPDTTEVVLSDHLTAGDYTDVDPASVSDVTGTAGFQAPVVAGVVEYAYVTIGSPLLVFDAAAGAAQAVVLFEGDLGNNTNNANLEPGIEITGEVADLTALDEILVGAGLQTHFIWSDKAYTSPSHSENTPDWTTGYLVNTLATDSRTMSF